MSSDPNPFASPQAPTGVRNGEVGETYAPCPRCGGTEGLRIGFTWWGGKLGPWLLTHVRCLTCGLKYNGKSGRSNLKGIIIYQAVGTAIGLLLMAAMLFF
jgi:hypothetical protein